MLAAAGAAGDLRQQLERPLGGAEVGEAEADVGARSTPTSVTRGKSCPFAIICVPTSTSISPAREPRQQRGDRAAAADGVAIEARDARAGNSAAHLRLDPLGAEARPARGTGRRTCGHAFGSAHGVVAVVAARAPRPPRCTVSDTLQFGHSSVPAHCRQNTAVAKPRRFSSTSACSPPLEPRARARRAAARLRITSGPVGGVLLAHVDDA